MTDAVKEVAKEAAVKDAVAKPVVKKAVSLYTGGDIRITPLHIGGPGGGEVGMSHEYIGTGPLLVPCSRGEQKAKSGDVLIETIIPDPTDPELDKVYLFLLPREVAEVLKSELVDTPPATQAEYQEFQDARARRKAGVIRAVTDKPAQKPSQKSS